ncbi:MAG TPA: DJ-1/PfpI family protein [Ohtaekwangia sp.]|nr:DJ-1/PfpI family protein [Ohtaekwangia sp.]
MALLSDQTIAILAGDGVLQTELVRPREALEKASVKVEVVSLRGNEVTAWVNEAWSIRVKIDKHVQAVNIDDYDGLLLPGGRHVENIYQNQAVANLIKQFFGSGKLIGAIGHGVQFLAGAHVTEGRMIASAPELKPAIEESGGIWKDINVVTDNGVITCDSGKNIDAFNTIFIDELRKGIRQRTETII